MAKAEQFKFPVFTNAVQGALKLILEAALDGDVFRTPPDFDQ
jgi:hypothetical protein